MKTRFQKALIHERPGADFLSAAGLRLIPRLRISQVARQCERPSRIPPSKPVVTKPNHRRVHAPDWWRFAREWRNKEMDNFSSVSAGGKLFRCCAAGAAVVTLLLSAGCQSSNPEPPRYSNLDGVPHPKPAPVQMTTLQNRLDPTLLNAPTNFFILGPGDKLDIEMADETNSLTTTVVGPDGKIYFSLLPGVDVWGLTLGQARESIEHELGKYVRGEPQVSVTLRDVQSKRVWLLGRFQQPGVYTMTTPTTVLEAVAAAGGSQSFAGQRQISAGGPLGEDLADLHRSFIVRNGKMLPVDLYALIDKGDLSQNIYLQPDDFIYFAPAYAKEVYVLGAVTQPQPVQYVEGMTLIQAIAGAFGTIRDAYLAHVTIIRGSLASPQVAIVNYYDVVKGKVPDVELQPNDIVYIPLTPYRYLRKYLDVALDTFVTSVAINAGTRATTSGVSGVTIPIGGGGGVTTIPPPVPPIH
jgi:polysaccharide export outer membrane protein